MAGYADDDDDAAAAVPLNSTLVTAVLHEYCDEVPAWINDPVFLDPSSTLYLAVFSVVAFTIYHRLSGLAAKTVLAAFRCVLGR